LPGDSKRTAGRRRPLMTSCCGVLFGSKVSCARRRGVSVRVGFPTLYPKHLHALPPSCTVQPGQLWRCPAGHNAVLQGGLSALQMLAGCTKPRTTGPLSSQSMGRTWVLQARSESPRGQATQGRGLRIMKPAFHGRLQPRHHRSERQKRREHSTRNAPLPAGAPAHART